MGRIFSATPKISVAAPARTNAHTAIAAVAPKPNGFSGGTAGTLAAGVQLAWGSLQFTVEEQAVCCEDASCSHAGLAMPLTFLGGSAADSDDAGAAGICYR